MAHRDTRDQVSTRQEALAWLAEQLQWEAHLDGLRRPRGDRPRPRRQARPDPRLRQAS
ncbi:MAG: hypothetical protein ACRDY6_20665 [Acidimicrobiia bacterium]